MAKVTNQNIPPDLAALYAAMTSPAKITQGDNGAIAIKKNKKKPKKNRRADLDLDAFKDVVDQVRIEMEQQGNTPVSKDWLFALTRELIIGVFRDSLFKKCKVLSAVSLQSVPTSIVDPDPPAYGFRTQNFMPTIPTYPDGEASGTTPGFHGAKAGAHFYDDLLVWRKIAYDADSINMLAGIRRVLAKWNTTIHIDATSRGSRPMYSLNLRAQVCRASGSALTSTKAPIIAKSTLYWRFKLPIATAPFFHTTQYVRHSIPFARIAKDSGSGAVFCYLLNASNRPMMGRGYNNNDTVQTTFDNDPELWEIRKCINALNRAWVVVGNAPWYDYRGMCWGPGAGMFVGVQSGSATGYIVRSPDGKTWTPVSTGANSKFWGVTWSPELGLFCAVGVSPQVGAIATSPNGTNWTIRSAPFIGGWKAVAWSPQLGIFCAVSNTNATTGIITSPDGINWTSRTLADLRPLKAIVWAPEKNLFVAVVQPNDGKQFATSPDGVNWSYVDITTSRQIESIAWSPELGLFVAVDGFGGTPQPDGTQGPEADVFLTSPDGLNWSVVHTGYAGSYFTVCWSPELGKFLAAGSRVMQPEARSNVLESFDGQSWSLSPGVPGSVWTASAWSPELCRFVLASFPDNNRPITYL
jgi:hypothetical protein